MKKIVQSVVWLALLCWVSAAIAAVPGTVRLLDFSFDAATTGGGYLAGFTPPSDGKLVVTFENPDGSADGNYHIYGRLPSDYYPSRLWDRMNLTGVPAPGISAYFTPNLKGFKSTTIEFSIYTTWGQTDIGCAYDPTGFSTGVDLTGTDRITVDFVPVTIESELPKARLLTSITSQPTEANSVTTTFVADRPGRIIMHATSKGSGGGGHFVYLNDVAIGGIDTGEFNYSSPTYKTIPVREAGTYSLTVAHQDSYFWDNYGVRGTEVYFIPNEPVTYYVRPDGLDQNDGLTNSSLGAFKTIQHAVDVALPGDTVEVQEGVYTEQLYIGCSGTAEKRITITGNGKAVLDGNGVLGSNGFDGSYVDFTNMEVRNYAGYGLHVSGLNNTIKNCDFHDNYSNIGVLPEGGKLLVKGTKIHNFNNVTGQGYDIRLYFTTQGVTFEDCDIYDEPGLAIWFAHTQSDNYIIGCRFYNNNQATGTGDLIGAAHIYNSTFYNNGVALSTWDDRAGSIKEWKNNIVVNNGVGLSKSGADNGTVINDYNLVFGNTTNYDTAWGLTPGSNDIAADPLFVDAAAANFRLKAFSPALDKGVDLGRPFYGAAPDLGAYEKTTVDATIVLDRQAPATGWFTSPVTATVVTDIPAAVSSITATLGGVPTPYTGPLTISADGRHQLTAQVTDTAQVTGQASAPASINIDTTLPTLILGGVTNGGIYRTAAVSFNATDAMSAVQSVRCKVDNGAERIMNIQSGSISVTGNGVHTVSCYAVDIAGNASATSSVQFTIDTIAPTITKTVPANGVSGVTLASSLVITFSEQVIPGAGFTNGILLKKGATVVPVSKVLSGKTLTIKPTAAMTKNSTYTLTIPANAVKDGAGNSLPALYTTSFRTGAK